MQWCYLLRSFTIWKHYWCTFAVGGVSPTTGVTISKSLNVCTICGMTLDGAQMASAVHLRLWAVCHAPLTAGSPAAVPAGTDRAVRSRVWARKGVLAFIDSSFPITKHFSYLKGSCNGECLRYFLILELTSKHLDVQRTSYRIQEGVPEHVTQGHTL